mgnify:CR=1 FL=1
MAEFAIHLTRISLILAIQRSLLVGGSVLPMCPANLPGSVMATAEWAVTLQGKAAAADGSARAR